MAKQRNYGWNGEMPAKAVSGQCAIVLTGLKEEPEAMRTGKEWAEKIGPQLKTKQDPYRVVLYYILILKTKGCVKTAEFDINAVTIANEVKHGVTVRTASAVDHRELVAEEPAADEVIAE